MDFEREEEKRAEPKFPAAQALRPGTNLADDQQQQPDQAEIGVVARHLVHDARLVRGQRVQLGARLGEAAKSARTVSRSQRKFG